jgi:hypothetical protein
MAEAPIYVASKLLEFGTRTSMEVEKPAGSKEGDILCIFPYVEVNGKVISIAGATEITPQAQSGITFRQGAFWLVHDGTANKIKVTWEGSESKGCVVAIDAWRGVDQKNPIDVTSVLTAFTSTKTPKAPSIVTVTANAVEVVMEVNNAGTLLNKAPAGFTIRTNYSPATASIVRETGGATGETELELTTARTGLVMSFALKPAEGSKAGPRPGSLALLGVGR